MSSLGPGAQVVLLASVDWGAAWQRHHAWAAAFAARGAEVFFVENTGFRDLRPADLARVGGRLRRLWRPRAGTKAPRRVKVISPLVLPPTRPLFRTLNAVYFVPWLLRRLRQRGLKPGATVFAYLPTATTLQLLDRLEPGLVVYDCVDNFAGHPTPPADLAATEAALLAHSGLVLTTSSYLQERQSGRHALVRRIHHGVSEAFLGAPRAKAPLRRLCYFGTLWSAVDYDAVRALAEAGYAVTLTGPVKEPLPALPPSVTLHRPLRHEDLPAFLGGFDALLLPYVSSEYNKGVVPAKLYECLATGKPVLASALPSLEEYGDLLYLARRPEEFPELARRAGDEDGAALSARRIGAARAHTTAAQALRVEGLLDAEPRAEVAAPTRALERGESFLRGFSWIAGLFTAARLSTFAVQFVGARVLGPSVYGTAHLVGAVAALVQTLPMLGFPLALSHFTASAEGETESGRLVTTGLLSFAVWAALCAAGFAAFAPQLGALSGLPPRSWGLAAALAVATAVHHACSGSLQGLGRFRERGAVEALYGALSLAFLLAGVAAGLRSFETLVASYVAGLAAAAATSLVILYRRWRGSFDAALLPRLLPYAALGTVNVAGAALVQAPGRIVTYRLGSAAATGLYSAYFACTVQVALAVSNMLQTVLIPLASRPAGRRDTWAAMRAALPAALAAGWAVFSVVAVAALLLLGRAYPLDAGWVLLFAAAAALVLVHGAAQSLFSAGGLPGLGVAAAGTLLAGVGNLAFNMVLTPRLGMPGAALSLCIGYGAGTLWYAWWLRATEAA